MVKELKNESTLIYFTIHCHHTVSGECVMNPTKVEKREFVLTKIFMVV